MTQQRPKTETGLDKAGALFGDAHTNFAALARLLARHAVLVSSREATAIRTDTVGSREVPPAGEQNGGGAEMNSQSLLKLSRVAKLLDMSTKTVRRLVERRELIAIRIGGQWRIDPRDLAAYLACHRTEPMDLDFGVQRIPPVSK